MKYIVILLMIAFSLSVVFANDGAMSGAGGNIDLNFENPDIQIKNEILTFTLFEKSCHISVRYDFYNYGEKQIVTTAFPEFDFGYGSDLWTPITGFQVSYITGEDIPVRKEATDERTMPIRMHSWFKKEITFESKAYTSICINYAVNYSYVMTHSDEISYWLGTGRTWKGAIENLTIRIDNRSNKWINSFRIGNGIEYEYKYIAEGIYEANLKEHEPDHFEIIKIVVSDDNKYAIPPNQEFPKQSFRLKYEKISEDKLMFYSRNQLRLLRNAIFANNGYKFTSDSLNMYFENKYWYQDDLIFEESNINEIEKYNIDFLLSIEENFQ